MRNVAQQPRRPDASICAADMPLPHRLFTATADAAVVLSEEAALELVDDFGRDLSHRRDVCAKAAKRAGASALAGGWATDNSPAPTILSKRWP